MPRRDDRDPYGAGKERARLIKPKTEASDAEATRRLWDAHGKLNPEQQQADARRKRGAAQLLAFKQASEGEDYTRAVTGIMLDTARNFDTFAEIFKDGGLNIADVRCTIEGSFKGCKNLQEVRDAMTGAGKFNGQKAITIKRGKHDFSWKVHLTEKQFNDLETSYRDPNAGRDGSAR